jgi:hypothetical protein
MLVTAAVLLNSEDVKVTFLEKLPAFPLMLLMVVFLVVLAKSRMSKTPAAKMFAELSLEPLAPKNMFALDVNALLATLDPSPNNL